ncbi:MAG: thiamine phosphate synthase [Deltaproteobacteria bacterium]
MNLPAAIELLVFTDPGGPRGLVPYYVALRDVTPRWAIVVRDHDADDDTLRRRVEALRGARSAVPLLLAVASPARAKLAASMGLEGVHLAERGPSGLEARAALGDAAWVSASVHDARGLLRRAAERVDFVTLAPFGQVAGKGSPLEDDDVQAVTRLGTPVLALGGLRGVEDARRAVALGCRGIAVRSWIATASDGARALEDARGWLAHALETRPCATFPVD